MAATHEQAQGRRSWRAALSGFLAVAVMLGVSELLAAVVPGARSHVVAVGDEIIDRTPGWLERAVIQNLGTSDKPFLIANVLVASVLLGALLGVLAARRFALGAAGLALMAAVGATAAFRDPQTDSLAPLWVGIASAAAGIATLWLLLRPRCRRRPSHAGRRTPRRSTGGGSSGWPAAPWSSPGSAACSAGCWPRAGRSTRSVRRSACRGR